MPLVNSGAMKPTDTRQVIVDTTVQPKNVMFPTDAKLIHRARVRLVRLARKVGLSLRQTYVRIGKFALIQHQRYAHPKQFKRAGKALRKLKTYLGRTIRDIERQIAGDEQLKAIFIWPLCRWLKFLAPAQVVQRLFVPASCHLHRSSAATPADFHLKPVLKRSLRQLCPPAIPARHTKTAFFPSD